jgi:hypothetical protein
MITFALPARVQAKGCGMVQLATNARELAVGLNSTGMTIMSNWPFPPATGAVPWTKAQEQAYNQAQRAQLPESPL